MPCTKFIKSAQTELGVYSVEIFVNKPPSPQLLPVLSLQKLRSPQRDTVKIHLDKPVLIVEDNEINQTVLKRILTSRGVDCKVASNGKEAVQCFEPNKFALIFMDVMMPEMNGLDATKAIRQIEKQTQPSLSDNNNLIRHSRVPIIGLSGNARHEHQLLAKEAGMDDYVIKPVLSETVVKMLQKYCNK